jgi:hypothetical protein
MAACSVCRVEMGWEPPSGVCSEACLRRGQGFAPPAAPVVCFCCRKAVAVRAVRDVGLMKYPACAACAKVIESMGGA